MEDLKNLVLTPFDGMLSLEQIAHQTLLLDDIQVRNGHFPSDNVLMVFNGGAVSPQDWTVFLQLCREPTNCRESAEKIEAYLSLMTRAAIILGAGDTKKARWDEGHDDDDCHIEQRPRSIDLSEESRQDRIIDLDLWHDPTLLFRSVDPCRNVVHHDGTMRIGMSC